MSPAVTRVRRAPRWVTLVAWSTGVAGCYVLASLAHAALVERILTVDVGFGRSLAFWIGSVYLLLLGWGFLPARPTGWYAALRVVWSLLAVGLLAVAVCGTYTALWLMLRWSPSVGGPVTASIATMIPASLGVLWLAGREDRLRWS